MFGLGCTPPAALQVVALDSGGHLVMDDCKVLCQVGMLAMYAAEGQPDCVVVVGTINPAGVSDTCLLRHTILIMASAIGASRRLS